MLRTLIQVKQGRNGNEIEITIPLAAAIFAGYAVLVYWPVLLGQRFFWEDFFIQEYPIRDYSFYMLGIRHVFPFWNPYSWSWAPLLADAQNAFWYPTNLLGISAVRFILPNASRLPILVPEILTLLHLPLGALGVFLLLRDRFKIRSIAALLAGLAWGFGARMVAEQNHPMEIIQLALLPWETILTMKAWNSIRSSVGLGVLLGFSFLAGQPQTFLIISLFLGAFSFWEAVRRLRFGKNKIHSLIPVGSFCLAASIATGVAAIQLLPLFQLASLSLRQHLAYPDAAMGSLHPFRLITFFVPKFFGEFPNYSVPALAKFRANGMWYWEGIFYWGVLAEIIAIFGIIRLWKDRHSSNPNAQYAGFFIAFSIFALIYSMGSNAGVQWFFWRFIPIFDHIRMPNRMLWFFWFIGTLATGLGIEELLSSPGVLQTYRRYFYYASAVFVGLNLLAMSGVFHIFIHPHNYQQIPSVMMHSLVASIAALGFFYFFIEKKISPRWLLASIAFLMIADLYYVDFTWHRNTLDRETLVAVEAHSKSIGDFEQLHKSDHSKLLLLEAPEQREKDLNLGMFIRLPIEFSADSNELLADNPMRLTNIFPPVLDSIRRMEIMGVSMTVLPDGEEVRDSSALPFIKLYHHWMVAGDRMQAARILNKPDFDFHDTVLLQTAPAFGCPTGQAGPDSLCLLLYSENQISIFVRTTKPGILLVNDLYYPAWKATVDGKGEMILHAFSSLRAVPVSSGTHAIELHYDSSLFVFGWKISAATVLFSILMLVGLRKSNG